VKYSVSKISVKLMAVTASLLVTVALVVPAVASAKTYKVKLTNTSHSGASTKLTGTVKGAPLGTCKYTGTLTIPNTTQVWRCHGGKIYVSSHGTSGVSNNARGTWKVTKGTGRYKHIKGGGTLKGLLSTGTYTYKGTLKF
jgi:hypothetical protein